jgi:hypothetical protein
VQPVFTKNKGATAYRTSKAKTKMRFRNDMHEVTHRIFEITGTGNLSMVSIIQTGGR